MTAPPSDASPPPRLHREAAFASLVLGVLGLPTLGLLGVGALAAIGLGILALVQNSKAPQKFGGKGMAIGGIVTSVASLILALSLPVLIRPHVDTNETRTIGDIRAVISGEMAYKSANAGFYDTLDCLAAPARCIPNYNGPTFVDPALASLSTKEGYERRFHAGPAATPPQVNGSSPSSLRSFAYVAVPISGMTGIRGFCGDSSGRVCSTPDGSAPPVVDGQCSSSCTTF